MATASMEVRRPENRGRAGAPRERRSLKSPDGNGPAPSPRRALERSGEAAKQPKRGEILAVASGKGGVGKSNIAVGLGIMLAAGGSRVAIIDADGGAGDLDVLLNVSGGPTLADVRHGGRRLADVLIPTAGGVSLARGSYLAGREDLAAAVRRAEILDGVTELRESHDFVIIDCGSGVGTDVLEPCRRAGHVLVVTTPEPTAITDAYGLIKLLAGCGYPGRLSVLVNMAASRDEARFTYGRLAGVSWQFLHRTVFDAGYVLTDPKVPAAVRARRPVVLAHPRCPASRCLAALSVKLQPDLGHAEPKGVMSGLAKKLRKLVRHA